MSRFAVSAVLALFLSPLAACVDPTLDEVTEDELADDAIQGATGSGVCNAVALEVIVKGRENRFGLDGQQVALNADIPIERICQRVVNDCKQRCADARAKVAASGVRGFQDADPVKLNKMGVVADEFNAALGLTTRFRDLGSATPPPPPPPGGGGGGGGAVACNAKKLEVSFRGKEHRFGFDNRQVALNPAIPMQNICQQVASGCQTTCNTAKAAAEATGIKGFSGDDDPVKLRQMGELADAFNKALGNTTNFTQNPLNLN
jgi:hypothetical protein